MQNYTCTAQLPEPRDIQTARTLANINRRAMTLFQGGYSAKPSQLTGLYVVGGPQGQEYDVLCDEVMGYHCTCKAFQTFTTCKHILAVDMLRSDEAQAARYDALHAFADDDPFAEF